MAEAPEPPLTARMQHAASEPPLGPLRDPLPDGIDLEPLRGAVGALREHHAPRGGLRGKLRSVVRRASGAQDPALLESMDALFHALASLNHQVRAHADRLGEHEERLRGIEVQAEEAALRAPVLPSG